MIDQQKLQMVLDYRELSKRKKIELQEKDPDKFEELVKAGNTVWSQWQHELAEKAYYEDKDGKLCKSREVLALPYSGGMVPCWQKPWRLAKKIKRGAPLTTPEPSSTEPTALKELVTKIQPEKRG